MTIMRKLWGKSVVFLLVLGLCLLGSNQDTDMPAVPGQAACGECYEGVSFYYEEGTFPYFHQRDARWRSVGYGRESTIGSAGCGPTTMAMVLSALTGRVHTPVEISRWSESRGYYREGKGTYHILIPDCGKAFGLTVEGLGEGTPESRALAIEKALQAGKLVVAVMGKGHFTKGGHFILIRGREGNRKVWIADSASYSRSSIPWELSLLLREVRKESEGGGPIWVIGSAKSANISPDLR